MELILVGVVLVLVAAIVLHDAEPRGHRRARHQRHMRARVELAPDIDLKLDDPATASLGPASSNGSGAVLQPAVGVASTTEASSARDIVPGDPRVTEGKSVTQTAGPASIGLAEPPEDSDHFFQTQVLETVGSARTLFATLRLVAVVVLCGVFAGVLLVLMGRGIGLLIRRFAGA